MDRAERTGVAIAVLGHVGLFALLVSGLLQPTKLPKIENEPVEVELVSEVAPVARAPEPAQLPPAPKLAPEPGPPADAPEAPKPVTVPPPTPKPVAPPKPQPQPAPKPVPAPRPVPKPVPLPKPKPAPPKPVPPKPAAPKPVRSTPVQAVPARTIPAKPAPAKPATGKPKPAGASRVAEPKPATKPGSGRPGLAVRPTGALNGLLTGSGHAAGASTTPTPAATKPGPPAVDIAAVKRALASEFARQLKPRWKSPTGADVDQLVTILSWNLNQDGSLAGDPTFVSQAGETPSNSAQAKLHRENAIKAVRAAAPFKLPAEHYALWKSVISFRFDKRLSQ